jgi:hypothetical protein
MRIILYLALTAIACFGQIAQDNSTSGSSGFSSVLNFNHTVNSNTNGILILGIVTKSDPTSFTAVTYNSVAMTQVLADTTTGFWWVYLYYLLAPSSGTHQVHIACSASSVSMMATAMSYTGAQQSGVPDASNKHVSTGELTPGLVSLTPSAVNSWYIGFAIGGNSAAGGDTARSPSTGNGDSFMGFDSNATISGTQNPGVVIDGGFGTDVVFAVTIAPTGGSTPPSVIHKPLWANSRWFKSSWFKDWMPMENRPYAR